MSAGTFVVGVCGAQGAAADTEVRPVSRITATFFTTIDGVVEAPEEWHFPYFSDAMGAALATGLARAEVLLYGRTTYDIQAAAWSAGPAARARRPG